MEESYSFSIKEQFSLIRNGELVGKVTLLDVPDNQAKKTSHTIQHIDSDMQLLQVNIDDLNPEILAYVTEQLFAAGANDVFSQPIIMKKGRSATMLTVLCGRESVKAIETIIFRETTTLGIRRLATTVHRLAREIDSISTPWGEVKIKIGRQNGKITQISPEFEDCKKVAEQNNIPLKLVYNWINNQTTERY
ncbi:LarC family nickel insertion protein [Pseudalkalibacillus caeni]|uniref:LarC family nickel insertion protein n=2 Tax=Exobacillus caeni TaxID=2574798 RepID=A0A5R9F6D4_9BACL|nr:LarC family nickel insertion protein [Pseudalkalibacillus caeni]